MVKGHIMVFPNEPDFINSIKSRSTPLKLEELIAEKTLRKKNFNEQFLIMTKPWSNYVKTHS